MWRVDSFEKTLMLGKIEGRRRRGGQRMRWLDGITDSMAWVWASSGRCDGQGNLACCSPWGRKESDMTEWVNWTEIQITVFQKPSDKEIYLRTEIKRYLFLGRKAMTNLHSVFKSRDITLLTKVHLVKAMVFTVDIYGPESWKENRVWKNWCF